MRPPTLRPDTVGGGRLWQPCRCRQAGAGRRRDPDEKDATVQSAYLVATSEVGDDAALLDLLLDAGATAESRDSSNGTGLIRAAERGYPRIIARLLDTDIDVNHVNRFGWTALHEAIVLGDGGQPTSRSSACSSTPARM